MSQTHTLTKPLFKQHFDVQRVFFYLLMAACLLSASLIFAFWLLEWQIWILGFLIIAAWMPLVLSVTNTISQQHRGLALLYLLVMSQIAHMMEHLAQMVELHVLGFPTLKANGIIGFLNNEWVHLLWNSWVLLLVSILLFVCRNNIWLLILFFFAIYHEAEHVYMVSVYIQTGIAGSPGLLARGGLIGGGLPISRLDLHALYAVLEEAMLLMIYFIERGKFRQAQTLQGKGTTWLENSLGGQLCLLDQGLPVSLEQRLLATDQSAPQDA